MCGGGGGSYSAPKTDPVPTAVQSADVNVDTSAGNKQRKKRGSGNNNLSNDRSILGGLTSGGSNLTRTTLG